MLARVFDRPYEDRTHPRNENACHANFIIQHEEDYWTETTGSPFFFPSFLSSFLSFLLFQTFARRRTQGKVHLSCSRHVHGSSLVMRVCALRATINFERFGSTAFAEDVAVMSTRFKVISSGLQRFLTCHPYSLSLSLSPFIYTYV